MPGPKYVNQFEFPSSFGFSGSASDRMTTMVRGHERKMPHRMAKGGRAVRKAPPSGLTARQKLIGAGIGTALAAGAASQLRDKPKRSERLSVRDTMEGGVRQRRERELGLKHGGKVPRFAKGGVVKKGSAGINRMSFSEKNVKTSRGPSVHPEKMRRILGAGALSQANAERMRQHIPKGARPRAMGGPVSYKHGGRKS